MGYSVVNYFFETLEKLKQLVMSSGLDFDVDKADQLQSLEEQINSLKEFLTETEEKCNKHLEVMELMTRIRDVVFEAENIIEGFVVHASKDDRAADFIHQHQDLFFQDLESIRKAIATLVAMVKHIKDNKLYNIDEVANPKHTSAGSGGLGLSPVRRYASEEGQKKLVVGFEKEVDELLGLLSNSCKDLEIILLVGTAGGGKTTIAKEVYDKPLTLQTFEVRAWVVLSQDYDETTMKRGLLLSILEQASQDKFKQEEHEKSNADMLGEKIKICLKGKKYLIVIDDIWRSEDWYHVQRSFLGECEGSKVLLTSREPILEDSICHIYRLPLLDGHSSWKLLEMQVFGMEGCKEAELAAIGKQVATKCGGLPLAVVLIAGILKTKDKTLCAWEKVAKDLSSHFAENPEGCMEIVAFSYNHLPPHLKACFLYIGGYPEDKEISIRELIWLWIAEGFIQKSEGSTCFEAEANGYLTSLIERSLVMIASESRLGRDHGDRIKTCRIHDLLRQFCLRKAKEDNFLVKIYKDDSLSHEESSSSVHKYRRFFIGSQFFERFTTIFPRPPNLRSFLGVNLQNSSRQSFEQNLSFFVENFELLRVLSLISIPYQGYMESDSIGHLVCLRYLALQILSPDLFKVPFSYLLDLETLNIQFRSQYTFINLPQDILKMVKLRHLYTKNGVFQWDPFMPWTIGRSLKLDGLQTLHQICGCAVCQKLLVRTPNLKKLGVYGELISRDGILLGADLSVLECLETLSFTNSTFGDKHLASNHPAGLKLPQTVKQLTLKETCLKWEQLSFLLTTLPNLEILKLLKKACVGSVWDTSEVEWFSKIKYLRLEHLDVEEWIADEDQYPGLEVLVLRYCRKLKKICSPRNVRP